MSDTKARELGITPLARIVSTGVTALSPEIMGLGPVEASRRAAKGRRLLSEHHFWCLVQSVSRGPVLGVPVDKIIGAGAPKFVVKHPGVVGK